MWAMLLVQDRHNFSTPLSGPHGIKVLRMFYGSRFTLNMRRAIIAESYLYICTL